jgi:sarcosine oxidase/L-pipecolate oxidase
MQRWKQDLLFSPHYHETGFIMASASDAAYQACLDYAKSEKTPLVPLNTAVDFKATMPRSVLQGDFPGWRGFWKEKGAGWVSASGALTAMHDEAARLGVRFLTGDPVGQVIEVRYNEDKTAVLGVRTADGVEHTAVHTVLAAGASSCQLLDFQDQLRPTAWTLAHLPLTEDEAHSYHNLPILYEGDETM